MLPNLFFFEFQTQGFNSSFQETEISLKHCLINYRKKKIMVSLNKDHNDFFSENTHDMGHDGVFQDFHSHRNMTGTLVLPGGLWSFKE